MRANNATPSRLPRRDCFFGLHFDLHPQKGDTQLGRDISEEMISNLLEKVRPDFVQYDCKGHAGYTGYPTKVGWPSPGIVKDSLALWRKVTKERGVGLYIHYSGVWDTVACQNRPEWARVDADGRPDPNNTSTFGPYVNELLIPQLKEVTDAYDLDGMWIDGECWAVQPDYSEAALKAFRDATGIIDTPKKRTDPGWLEFLEFHRARFREYVSHYLEALHNHKPNIQIASNWMYTTFMPEPVTIQVDYLSGDYSPGNSIESARLDARYLASTGMPWDLLAWGFNKGEKGNWSLKTPIHLMQEAAVVLAQGGAFAIYYQPTRAGWIDDWMVDVMADVARFCRDRQPVSHHTESVPQVALLLSAKSFYDRLDRLFSPWGGELIPIHGALHALLELHYSVDVLAEHQLVGRLHEYPVVVVPESHLLPEEFRARLLGYVRQGGNLVLLGPAAAALFRDELGVSFEDEPAQMSTQVQAEGRMANVPGDWQAITPATAETLAKRFPGYDPRQEDSPAATIAACGNGQIAAVYGPVASAYYDSHHPTIRRLMAVLMKRLLPAPLVEVDGPPCVDVAIRRSGSRLLVHLSNVAGMQTAPRYAVIDHILVVGPINLTIRLESPPRSVTLAPDGESLKTDWTGESLRVTVPRLEIHDVVVIE
jgi:hypothetical protein